MGWWHLPCSISCPKNSPPSRESSSFQRDRGRSGVPTAPNGPDVTGSQPRKLSTPPTGPTAELEKVLEESVAAHMVADVPVASFLSGGLDSSLITAMAAHHDPSIEAYTITFRAEDQRLEAMPDDAAYARKMAAHLGIQLHEIEISPDVVDMLPRVVEVLDEPIGDPGAINTVLMCQAARDAGVKVLLSGMGADELFGGYRKHLACVLGARYQTLPQSLRSRVVTPSVNRLPVAAGGRGLRYSRWAKRFLSFAELPEEAAFRRSYTLYDPAELAGLLDPELAPRVQGVVDAHRTLYTDNQLSDHVNRMCLTDARLFLPGLNLAYTDRSSMSASTEVRVPFVDPYVFRAAFSFGGSSEDQGTYAEGSVAGRRRGLGAAGGCRSPKGLVRRSVACLGDQRTRTFD